MVGLRDVVRRHVYYLLSVVAVLALSSNWTACFAALSILAYGLHRDSAHSITFMVIVGVILSALEVLMIAMQARTTRYDYALPELGIPLWLVPWWSVRAHWILDVYCVCGILQKKNHEKEDGCVV